MSTRTSSISTTPSFVKRYQIALFFILAYVLSWLVWGTYIAEQQGLIGFHLPESFFAYFALTLAVIIIALAVGGRAALMDILRRILRWRVSVKWYVLALVVPPVLCVISVLLYRAIGGSVVMGAEVSLGAAIAYFFMFGAKAWITEEAAWRGFVLPRLQTRYSALVSSLILGVMWGVWHTPLFLMNGTGQSRWPYLGFLIFAVAESVLTTWIYNSTGESVLLATLFHAATDAALSYSGLLSGDQNAFWLTVILHVIVAAVVVVYAGPARLVRGQTEQQAVAAPPGYVVT